MQRKRHIGLMAIHFTVLLALGMTAHSGETTTPNPAATAPTCACKPMAITVSAPGLAASRATDGIAIQNFTFMNSTLTVNVGDTVTWTNSDSSTHTATSDSGVFDTGPLTTGKSASFTFTKAGTFPYHCSIHPFMTATITVAGAAPTPGDISGTWTGSVKGKSFSITSTKVLADNGGVTIAFVQTGGGLTATVTLANSTVFNATGQAGNGNLWLLGRNDTQTFVFSGHLDKKSASIAGTGIIYGANGDQEITIKLKKQ